MKSSFVYIFPLPGVLLYLVANILSFFHSALSIIVFSGTPFSFAFDAAAALVEGVEELIMSISDISVTCLHHLAIVSSETALCGL